MDKDNNFIKKCIVSAVIGLITTFIGIVVVAYRRNERREDLPNEYTAEYQRLIGQNASAQGLPNYGTLQQDVDEGVDVGLSIHQYVQKTNAETDALNLNQGQLNVQQGQLNPNPANQDELNHNAVNQAQSNENDLDRDQLNGDDIIRGESDEKKFHDDQLNFGASDADRF